MIKTIKKFKRVNQHKLKTKKTCRKNKQTLKKHIGGAVSPGITTICSRIAHSIKNAFMSCMPNRRHTSNISLGSNKLSFEDKIKKEFERINTEYIENTSKLLNENMQNINNLFSEIPINLQKILKLLQKQSNTIYTNQETFFNTQLNTIETVINSFNVKESEDKDLYNKINIYKKPLILEHNNKRLYLYEYLHRNTIYYIAQYISIYNNNNNNNNTTRKTHIDDIHTHINTLNTDFNTQIEKINKYNNTKLDEYKYNDTCMPDAAKQISNANKQKTINNLFPKVPTSKKNTKNTSEHNNNGDIYEEMFNKYNLTILRKSLPVVPTEEAIQQHHNDEFERIQEIFNKLTNNKYV